MRVASYSRVRVNQDGGDAFIIKLNIGRLNCSSALVRMTHWGRFGADEKMKRQRGPELEKARKNTDISSAQVRVCDQACLHGTGGRTKWAITVGKI